MATKKDFTRADNAIDKLFSPKQTTQTNDTDITKDTKNTIDENNTEDAKNSNNENDTKNTYKTNISKNNKHTHKTNNTNNKNNTKPTNKSKHYEERGRRGERFGLLLDEKLKDDLTHLSKATGSKSVNDLIITVLIDFVEQEGNQAKLKQFRKLLQG